MSTPAASIETAPAVGEAMVFISHSSQDRQTARTISTALENRGYRCWVSSRDISPGENFQEAIVRAIRRARVMVLVFTGNANNSNEIKKEMALASQNNLAVIPVRVEDVIPDDAFAYEFATRQWIDTFNDWEQAVERLVLQVSAVLQTDTAVDAPAPGATPRPARTRLGRARRARRAAPGAAEPSAPTASTEPTPPAPAFASKRAPALVAAGLAVLAAVVAGGYLAFKPASSPKPNPGQPVAIAESGPSTAQRSAAAPPSSNPSVETAPAPAVVASREGTAGPTSPAPNASGGPPPQSATASEGTTIVLPPTIEFETASDQLRVVRPTPVFLAPNPHAPQEFTVKEGTMIQVIAKSKDGTWAWVTTADGAPAYIAIADLGPSPNASQ